MECERCNKVKPTINVRFRYNNIYRRNLKEVCLDCIKKNDVVRI